MKIENNNNKAQSFGKLYIYSSKMNTVQQVLSDKVADSISISKSYRQADDRNIDVYILPHTQDPNSINIRYMDGWSDNYFRKDGRILQTAGHKDELISSIVSRVKKHLDKILNGQVKYPIGKISEKPEDSSDLKNLRIDLF